MTKIAVPKVRQISLKASVSTIDSWRPVEKHLEDRVAQELKKEEL